MSFFRRVSLTYGEYSICVPIFLATVLFAGTAAAQDSEISCQEQLADREIAAANGAYLTDIDRMIARSGCLDSILSRIKTVEEAMVVAIARAKNAELAVTDLTVKLETCQLAEPNCLETRSEPSLSEERIAEIIRRELEPFSALPDSVDAIADAIAGRTGDSGIDPFAQSNPATKAATADLLQYILDAHVAALGLDEGCAEFELRPIGNIPGDDGVVSLLASGAISAEADRDALIGLALPIPFAINDELKIDPAAVSCTGPVGQIETDAGYLITVDANGEVVTVFESEARARIVSLPPMEDCQDIAELIDTLSELNTYGQTVSRNRQGAWTRDGDFVAACAMVGGRFQQVFNPEPLASYILLKPQS